MPSSSASIASMTLGSTAPLLINATATAPRDMNVAITFSYAIKPVIAATAKIQPIDDNCEPNPNGVNKG